MRIGVFICHCGSNIGGTVDCAKVAETARAYPDVVYAVDLMYSCAEPGQAAIEAAIHEHKLDGVEVPAFDPLSDLDRVEPVVTMLPGWEQDISGCTRWDELPEAAKNYVQFLEKQLNHEIQFVSTGAEREKFVLKGAWL